MINLGGRVGIHPRPVLGPQAPHRDARAETSCASGTLNCRGSRFPDCHQARHAAITIQARFPGQTRIDDEPHPRHRQGRFRNRRRDDDTARITWVRQGMILLTHRHRP